MEQQELLTELTEIQQKLKQLLERYSALVKENKTLLLQKENLQTLLASKDEEISRLQEESDILKSGIQSWHPQQKKLFAKRIDQYLKEIEKCLAIVNE